jgi:SnoaL-like polyketide cyclase
MPTRRTRIAVPAIAAVALLGGIAVANGGNEVVAHASAATTAPLTRTQLLAEHRQLQKLLASNAVVRGNLKTFDTLDFEVYSNQRWDRLAESHAPNVKVFYPDGHTTTGLDAHIAELKQLFVYAPDARITEHPIGFGSGNQTAVTGVLRGTFTEPLPDGKGGVVPPNGRVFALSMATIAVWKNGLIVEEHLLWDNQSFAKQLGLA